MFVGRQREIAALHRGMDNLRPTLGIVYGRRRVGKSTLLQKVFDDRAHIYFQATRVSDVDAQALFKQAAESVLGPDPLLANLTGWEPILRYLRGRAKETAKDGRWPMVVTLDEFPYLCEENRALPSIVQKVWDEVRAADEPFKLVLCGSHVAFMEELLAEKNPLYGRQSLKLEVTALPYRDAVQLLPGWSPADRLRAYGVFGGMPYYLAMCNPAENLANNVCRLVLEDAAPLRDEPMHLLQAELQAPARYASILRAVADGLTERGEIVNRVMQKGESSNAIAPYIERLVRMRLLRPMQSLDAPERSRNTRYYLDDPFLAFHFRFVLPNLSALQSGHAELVWSGMINPRLDEYMGDRFEEICRSWLALYGQERLGMAAGRVGKIWAADYDVDVAGKLLDERLVAGECKWTRKPVGFTVFNDLKRDSARAQYYGGTEPIHILFARTGFTPELREHVADDPNVHLLTPDELLQPPH